MARVANRERLLRIESAVWGGSAFFVRRHYTLMKIVSLFAVFALCASGCGNHSIDEQKVVGSWQVVSPYPISVVYKFNPDHTYSIGDPSKTGKPIRFPAPCGHWRFDGNHLITDMGLMDTNNVQATSFLTSDSVSYRVTSITDSSMVWHDDTHLMGMTWKKINP